MDLGSLYHILGWMSRGKFVVSVGEGQDLVKPTSTPPVKKFLSQIEIKVDVAKQSVL
jgi:hypothetical protein